MSIRVLWPKILIALSVAGWIISFLLKLGVLSIIFGLVAIFISSINLLLRTGTIMLDANNAVPDLAKIPDMPPKVGTALTKLSHWFFVCCAVIFFALGAFLVVILGLAISGRLH